MPAKTSSQFHPPQDLLNGRPNTLFLYFLFQRWNIFLDSDLEKENVGILTAKLLSTCTDKQRRLELLKQFEDWSKPTDEGGLGSEITAAIMISGDFFAYVAESCELIETSTGGF
jgi:hypothetical protein